MRITFVWYIESVGIKRLFMDKSSVDKKLYVIRKYYLQCPLVFTVKFIYFDRFYY